MYIKNNMKNLTCYCKHTWSYSSGQRCTTLPSSQSGLPVPGLQEKAFSISLQVCLLKACSVLFCLFFFCVCVKTFIILKKFPSVPGLLRILCFVLFEFNAFFVVVAAFYYHMNFLLHYINILNYMLFKILNLTWFLR